MGIAYLIDRNGDELAHVSLSHVPSVGQAIDAGPARYVVIEHPRALIRSRPVVAVAVESRPRGALADDAEILVEVDRLPPVATVPTPQAPAPAPEVNVRAARSRRTVSNRHT